MSYCRIHGSGVPVVCGECYDERSAEVKACDARAARFDSECARLRSENEKLKDDLFRCGKENCMGRRVDGARSWVSKESLEAAESKLATLRKLYDATYADFILRGEERDTLRIELGEARAAWANAIGMNPYYYTSLIPKKPKKNKEEGE